MPVLAGLVGGLWGLDEGSAEFLMIVAPIALLPALRRLDSSQSELDPALVRSLRFLGLLVLAAFLALLLISLHELVAFTPQATLVVTALLVFALFGPRIAVSRAISWRCGLLPGSPCLAACVSRLTCSVLLVTASVPQVTTAWLIHGPVAASALAMSWLGAHLLHAGWLGVHLASGGSRRIAVQVRA